MVCKELRPNGKLQAEGSIPSVSIFFKMICGYSLSAESDIFLNLYLPFPCPVTDSIKPASFSFEMIFPEVVNDSPVIMEISCLPKIYPGANSWNNLSILFFIDEVALIFSIATINKL